MLGGVGVRRVLAVVLLGSAAIVGPALGAPTPACSSLTKGVDLWTKIAAPHFASGGSQLTGYDVDRNYAPHLVTTNGDRIAVTFDGGCEWTPSSMPAAAPLPGLPLGDGGKVVSQSVTQVRIARDIAGVWAIGQTALVLPSSPATQPRILQSSNAGAGFADRSGSFPSSFGKPVAVAAISSTAAVVLFHQSVPSDTFQTYLTTDGGVNWTQLSTGLPSLSDVGVDCARGRVLAWGAAGLYSGALGGNACRSPSAPLDGTMTPLAGVGGPVRAVTFDEQGRTFTAYLAGQAVRLTSSDGGRTFVPRAEPDGLNFASQGPLPGLVALSSVATNVLVEPPVGTYFKGLKPTDFSPSADNVSDVRFVDTFDFKPNFRGVTFPLFAFNPTALFRRDIPADFHLPNLPPLPPLPPVDVNVHHVKPVRRTATVTPADSVISLLPGQKRTVGYRIGLPPIPTPLDVFFMTDSTGSMSEAITSVQEGVQQIVDSLAATGIDVHFGVADFKDYPAEDGNQAAAGSTDNYPYRRLRKIGPVDNELADALQSITTGGGTTDGDDSALEAVYQATTGAGRKDPLLVRPDLIPPGQGAEWRGKALKVILLASDDEMRHPENNPGYPGPSMSTVTGALQANGVHVVGIAVHTSSASAAADMKILARDSNTLAPAQGIDCDGDGQTDLSPNDPIVCPFSPSTGDSIAPTFIALLEGIRDYAAVDLQVQGDRAVAKPLAVTHFPKVNVKAPSDYRLPVQFSCDTAHIGTTTVVSIGAQSRGRTVASTTATVKCLVPQPVDRPKPPVLLPAVVPPPPPPPPAPVTNAQPNPNPNPNPNPQVNANAGAATNEEDQAQLALAEGDQGEAIEGGNEVAFSARKTNQLPLPDVAWVGIVMIMASAAFGTHLSRRASTWGQLRTQEHR